jgi:hypothetical protein
MNWKSLLGAATLAGILGATGGQLFNLGNYGPVVHNYSLPSTDDAFKVASTAASKTVFTLATDQKLMGLCLTPRTAFAGTGISAISCSVGTATGGNEAIYVPLLDVMQTTGTKCVGGLYSGSDLATPDTNKAVVVYCTATGASFGNGAATVLTQGAVSVSIITVQLPAAAVVGTPGLDGG